MKQYVADRDYEMDFSHRSMLKATVTQLGITSEQCETACLPVTDDASACAIATYWLRLRPWAIRRGAASLGWLAGAL